jgi:hypothetical protein
MIDDEPVPGSVRYQALKRDRRCFAERPQKTSRFLWIIFFRAAREVRLASTIFKPSALSAMAARTTRTTPIFAKSSSSLTTGLARSFFVCRHSRKIHRQEKRF